MTRIFNNRKYLLLILFIMMFSLTQFALAQGRGKISGIVRDADTGELLPGVNVMLQGTNLGAATDFDGKFNIIGIPPGNYNLRASFIGYKAVIVQDLIVKTDLTTQQNIDMEPSTIETDEVIVTAEKKLVQRDVTSTRRTVTRESMDVLPGVESATDVFRLQGGTSIGGRPQMLERADGTTVQVRDESVKDVHVRGGRGGEILFMIDGVPVTHPIYGGRSVLDMNIVAVEQIELISGAFSAEYGQAQSGVVNITTRRGGEKFKGGLEYKTDHLGLFGENYNTDYGSMFFSGPEPITNYLLPAIGLDFPGKLTFFFSVNGQLTDTQYDNRRIRNDITFFGFDMTERQNNSENLNAKINWDITKEFRTTFSINGSWKNWTDFKWVWTQNPNNMASSRRDNINYNWLINHVLSEKTFYTLNFGYLGIDYNKSLYGQTPDDFWESQVVTRPDTSYAVLTPRYHIPTADPLTGFYDSLSAEAVWRDEVTQSYNFKADFTSQFHPEHLIKMGAEFQYHDIQYVDIQDGAYNLSPYGEYLYRGGDPVNPPPGPFPEFGKDRWVFNVKPMMASAYIQEKFEKEFIVLNAGLRFDMFMVGNDVTTDNYRNAWESVTKLNADWNSWTYKLSPRFGISFPILEQTVVFFSYGHFFQLPELQFFYRDPYVGELVGNPGLDYEQTILYEFGFTHQLFDDWVVDIKSYAKDISDQVEASYIEGATSIEGNAVQVFNNIGYSRARGLELEVTKGFSNYTLGKFTYTLQWADGYMSSAFGNEQIYSGSVPKPIRERRLAWDHRHQFVIQASVLSPKDDPISIFGFELPDDWNLTILANMSSGTPYTSYVLGGNVAELQKRENNATSPMTTTTDLKFHKNFDVFGTELTLMIDIFNLFDTNNISVWYGFNRETGKPFVYGDTEEGTNKFYDWFTMLNKRDPRAYSTGRYAKIGVKWAF